MAKLKENIKIAKKLIVESSYSQNFNYIYPFATENLVGAFEGTDFNNQNCLTVLGSTDQALDMILKGAKTITTFDINPISKYYLYLKIAAFLADLSFKEYLDFFCYYQYRIFNFDNYGAFNKKIFVKIAEYLEFINQESFIFWWELFDVFHPLEIRRFGLFAYDEEPYKILKDCINYLNPTDFEILKEKITSSSINFINDDLKNLDTQLNQEYDFIYLSNIIQYANRIFDTSNLEKSEQFIVELQKFKEIIYCLEKYLKSSGQLVAGYIYSPNINDENTAIFNHYARHKIFNEEYFTYKYFNNRHNLIGNKKIDTKDALLILRKTL